MRTHWRKRQLTLLVIPDADRPVRRVRFPQFVLYAAPALIVIAAVYTILWLSDAKAEYEITIEHLAAQLMDEKEYSLELEKDKDLTIANLQNEIIELSGQADKVMRQLLEIKRLEGEIREISDLPGAPEASVVGSGSRVSVLGADAGLAGVAGSSVDGAAIESVGSGSKLSYLYRWGGIPLHVWLGGAGGLSGAGGVANVPTQDQTDVLIDQTHTSYEALEEDLDRLNDRLTELRDALKQVEHLKRITPSIYPTRSRLITSKFGVRKDPFTRKPAFHSGIDFAGKVNDPVYATADGVVWKTGRKSDYGNYIIVDHTRGFRTVYMHLNKSLVKQGQQVKKGEKIGLLGSTGRSTGPHLHYEVWISGRQTNPMKYIP